MYVIYMYHSPSWIPTWIKSSNLNIHLLQIRSLLLDIVPLIPRLIHNLQTPLRRRLDIQSRHTDPVLRTQHISRRFGNMLSHQWFHAAHEIAINLLIIRHPLRMEMRRHNSRPERQHFDVGFPKLHAEDVL